MTGAAVHVDPSNADALAAWDGGDGSYWAEHEETFDAAVAAYQERLLAAAALGRGDHVLDLGCGTGRTARDAARRAPDGAVLGVDLSSKLVERARQRAAEEGIRNAQFVQADAQVHPFGPASFDVAVSRTGAMFFGDPVAAFANVGRALRPAGRLALLVWQRFEDNEWVQAFTTALADGRPVPTPPPGAPGPFSLADPGRVRAVLTSAGFADVALEDAREPMWFGADASSAYEFLRGQGLAVSMLQGLDDAGRTRALDALLATVRAHDSVDGVRYRSAAWIVTARKP